MPAWMTPLLRPDCPSQSAGFLSSRKTSLTRASASCHATAAPTAPPPTTTAPTRSTPLPVVLRSASRCAGRDGHHQGLLMVGEDHQVPGPDQEEREVLVMPGRVKDLHVGLGPEEILHRHAVLDRVEKCKDEAIGPDYLGARAEESPRCP